MLPLPFRSPIAWLPVVLACILALPTAAANAAIIPVNPGTNTLQTAVTTAANGDVLELVDGTYAGAVTVSGKDLTVRARAGSTPVISNNLGVTSAHRLVLQGLSFSSSVLVYTSHSNAALMLLQNTFKDAHIRCRGIKCIAIGNRLDPQNSAGSAYEFGVTGTDEVIFAGNEMLHRAFSTSSYEYFVFNGSSTHIVGNHFWLDAAGQAPFFPFVISGGVATIVGNRFEFSLDTALPGVQSTSPGMLRITNATALIRNNAFILKSASGISPGTTGYRVSALHAIDISQTGGDIRIHNNVFDYRNISFGASANPVEGAIRTQRHVQGLSGNAFLGINHGAVEVAAGVLANVTDNLCYQVDSACPGMAALTANPLFTNSAAGNYHLQPGSPAINAGPNSPLLVDIDGSRNDIGVHGGPFDLDQFDVQRGPGTVPFIYPLFEANKAIDGNGNLQIRLIGVARNQ